MSAASLTCRNIVKSFRKSEVLTGVDLDVASGSLVALLGSSGSGKTTLLRALMGFVRPDAGNVSVGGTVVSDSATHVATEKRGIGYVAQEGALFPHLNVARNVGFGMPKGERRSSARIGEVLELVGLNTNYASRNPADLSGGEQRRVALARALAPRPRVVLLDEPFSGLDASLRSETRDAVSAALGHENTTALLVTHDQAEALSMGNQVAVLRDGKIAQSGTPRDLYETPLDLDLARFLGDAVVIRATASGNTVDTPLGPISLRQSISGTVDIVLRPEQIRIGDAGTSAVVTRIEYFGRQTMVRMRLAQGDLELCAGVFGGPGPVVGSAVRVTVAGVGMAYQVAANDLA
jgi:iron(III) transport system ATP-binding protein